MVDNKAKILIVDDEVLSAETLQYKLEMNGFAVCEIAANGEDAVRIATSESPDFVLMDLRLAGEMDGVETAQAIRAKMPVPFAFISGYNKEEIEQRTQDIKPLAIFTKPFTFDFDTIIGFLRTHFNQ